MLFRFKNGAKNVLENGMIRFKKKLKILHVPVCMPERASTCTHNLLSTNISQEILKSLF